MIFWQRRTLKNPLFIQFQAVRSSLKNCSFDKLSSDTCTQVSGVLIESVCINADLSSFSLSFCDLNRFGGMSNCTIDKIGLMPLQTVQYGWVEIVFSLLPFSFTVMDLVPSSKRGHLSTGTTPHKPAEKRSK